MEILEQSVRAVKAIAPQIPDPSEITEELEIAERAAARGYFSPDEDERIRQVFADYLQSRAVLLMVLSELRQSVSRRKVSSKDYLKAFAVGFTVALILVRLGRSLIDAFAHHPVIRKKLDEAEPRYSIPAGQFSEVYRSVTRPKNILGFHKALLVAEYRREPLLALADDPVVGSIIPMLERELARIHEYGRFDGGRIVKHGIDRLRQAPRQSVKKVLFNLFKMSGSAIAEMQNPFHRKRVTRRIRRKMEALLEPGDVMITRHDDAMSNWFLPGFWPHGAMYVGSEAQRKALGISLSAERELKAMDPYSVLEAKKDGVLFRPLAETLHVDSFTVLRPRLSPEERGAALTRGVTHEGKLYDFEFDFRRADKLVCTEVVYRTFHGVGPIDFKLKPRSGRVCLSAEDVLDSALDDRYFDVLCVYGVGNNKLVVGDAARDVLVKSYR